MSTQVIELDRRQRPAALLYVLAAAMLLFLGILVYVWIAAKKANPIMLDEHGKPRACVILSQES